MKNTKISNKRSSLAIALWLLVGLVSLTSTTVSAQTIISPNTNFTANGTPSLNGFNGAVNTSDDLVYVAAAANCAAGNQVTASMVLTAATCPGEYSTATLTLNNLSGVPITNLVLALNLTGTAAVFNGEPYNLSNGLNLAEPNIFDPAYPAVVNAISTKTGAQTLALFNLPAGTSTLDLDVVLGITQTDLTFTVQQIPTNYNASGTVSTTAGITPGTVPTISGTPPGAVTIANPSISLNYSTTGANSVQWTSGTNGTFANAAAAITTYTINDTDRANGYVQFSLQAISASGCDASTSFNVNITGATFDYGDALITYDFNENIQPVAAAATLNSAIYLGSIAPSAEATAKHSALATDDGAEEDGLAVLVLPYPIASQTDYTLTVNVTNNASGRNAYLNGFIDWNNDGDFVGDQHERSAMVTVPSGGSSLQVVTLTFTVPSTFDATVTPSIFLRLRLSTDDLAAARPFGTAANGEVEDYKLTPSYCVKGGVTTGTALKSDVIISVMSITPSDVPVNNGYLVLDSKTKGMVITRMPTASLPAGANAVKGMLVYDTTANCLKMYDGTTWGCIVISCPD